MQSPLEMFSVADRVAIVTGASSGLGGRFSDVLAAAGAKVVMAARRADRLEAHVARLQELGREALAVPCDVTSEGDVDQLFGSAVDTYGQVDILVNNAGVVGAATADESLESFRRVLDINLTGVYTCARAAGKVMQRQGSGTIVNMASISGMIASDDVDSPSYVASKAGVINLTRDLAVRWAKRGIRVNALAPGYFPSEMTAEDFATQEGREFIATHTPLGRGGRVEELDGALLFLASDASSYVTGHTLVVDGGWTAR